MAKDIFQKENMQLNKTLFWDTNPDELDYEKHARFIIERVLTRGKLSDWFEALRYYGWERIKTESLQIRYLDDLTLSFCSVIFEIPKTQFRCYILKQSNPLPWNY